MAALLLTPRADNWASCIEPDKAFTIRDGNGQGRILYHWDATNGEWGEADPATTESQPRCRICRALVRPGLVYCSGLSECWRIGEGVPR